MFQTEILERIHQPSTKYLSKIFKNEKTTKRGPPTQNHWGDF